MLNYLKYPLVTVSAVIFTACSGGGTSTQERQSDSIAPVITLYGQSSLELSTNQQYKELGAKAIDKQDGTLKVQISHDIKNNLPGTYTVTYSAIDFSGNNTVSYRTVKVLSEKTPLEEYTKASNYIKYETAISTKNMEALSLKIKSHTSAPRDAASFIRANDVFITRKNNDIILHNNSYTKIKSLIGKYKDTNNQTHLVRLTFNTILQPSTDYILHSFPNDDTLEIYHTKELFDQSVSFAGTLCNDNMNTMQDITYCLPTLKEQNSYKLALSKLHHFYNSVDGLSSFIAWSKKESYKSIDISSTFSDYDEMKKSNLMHSFLKATLPNHKLTLKTLNDFKGYGGLASGEEVSLLGAKENSGWASLYKEFIEFENPMNSSAEQMYNLLHHEIMHAHGFSHTSGMTLGYSNAVGKIIDHLYTENSAPIVEVPKYVFDLSFKDENEMLLTLYNTSESNSEDLTVEVLSTDFISTKRMSTIEDNQFSLKLKNNPSMRFYVRVYGQDSEQVMSKLIYPYRFKKPLENIDTMKSYHVISHDNWEHIAKSNDENILMRPKHAEKLCKSWTGDYKARTASLRKVEEIEGIENTLLVHSPYTYKSYYTFTSQEHKEIAHDIILNDNTTSILCEVD